MKIYINITLLFLITLTYNLNASLDVQIDDVSFIKHPLECTIKRSFKLDTKKPWTIIIYMAAKNDLAPFARKNIIQLAKIGSTRFVNILVHLDILLPGKKIATLRYYVEKDKLVITNNQNPEAQGMDSGNPATVISNLDAQRDWGYAKDYVEAMWKMLQLDIPEDFVIATGQAYCVREFVTLAFNYIDITINWKGKGIQERGYDSLTGKLLVAIDPTYFRPTEINILCGDATRAKKILGWQPTVKFEELIRLMMMHDLSLIEQEIGNTHNTLHQKSFRTISGRYHEI